MKTRVLLLVAFAAASASAQSTNFTLYVSDDSRTSKIIEQYDTNGNGSLFAADTSGPTGVAFDQSRNLFVTDDAGTLRKIDTNGISTILTNGLMNPYVLAFDGVGNLYVGCWDNTIRKFATNGVEMIFADSNSVSGPNGMAFDRAGNLYLANYDANNIVKYATDGSVSVFADFPNAAGLAFDAAGNLFAADFNDSEIWKFDSNGAGTLFATNHLLYPNGLAFDTAGNLYAVNWGNSPGFVSKFTPDGQGVTFATASLTTPQFAAAWPLPPQLIPTNTTAIPIAPKISLTFTTNGLQLTISGMPGGNYTVEAAMNLGSSSWIPLVTNPAPFIYVESNPALFPQRFYRAISQ